MNIQTLMQFLTICQSIRNLLDLINFIFGITVLGSIVYITIKFTLDLMSVLSFFFINKNPFPLKGTVCIVVTGEKVKSCALILTLINNAQCRTLLSFFCILQYLHVSS